MIWFLLGCLAAEPIDHSQHQQLSNEITVAPAARQALMLQVVAVRQGSARLLRRAPAEISFAASYSVTTQTGGKLLRVNVPDAGGLVKKGQLLAAIYSPELLQELLELRASISLEWKQAAIARAKAQGASDALIQEVLDGKEPSAKFKLYAPANGVVRLKATEGSWLAPGSVIASLEAPDQLSARMTVAGRLPLPGTEVSLKALNGSSMASAKVAEVLQQGSAAGREVQLKLNTSIPVGIPLIGEWEEILNGLWVPVGALVDTGVRKIVFVESPMGFLPAPVEVGLSTGTEVEILKGLTGTERVAASAAFLLDSETQTGSVSHAGHGG